MGTGTNYAQRAAILAAARERAARRNETEHARPQANSADVYRAGMLVIVGSTIICGLVMMFCVACCRRCDRRRKHRSADYRPQASGRRPRADIYTLGIGLDERAYTNSRLMYGGGLEVVSPSIPPRADGTAPLPPPEIGPPPAYETMFRDNYVDIKRDHDPIKEPYPTEADADGGAQRPQKDVGSPPSYEAAVSVVPAPAPASAALAL